MLQRKAKINHHNNFLYFIFQKILILLLCFQIVDNFQFKQLSRFPLSNIINTRTSYTFIFYRTTTNQGASTAWNRQAVSSTAQVIVQFPIQYSITGVQTCNSIQIVTQTQTIQASGYTCAFQGRQIIFNNALLSLSNYFIKQITVVYGNVRNPSPAIRTGSFTGYIGIDIAVSAGGTAVDLVAATFSACSLTFGNGGYVNETSPAIVYVRTLNQLTSTSTIRITFPSYKLWIRDLSQTVLPISPSMSCTSIIGLNTNIICSGNFVSFTVIGSSLFSSTTPSNTQLSFQINNFLSPPTLQPIDPIRITSLTNGNQVDTCTIFVTGLKPKPFLSLTIQPVESQMLVNSKVGLKINMTLPDTVSETDVFRITFPASLSATFNNLTTSGSQGTPTLNGRVLTLQFDSFFKWTNWQQSFFVITFYTITAPTSIKQTLPINVEILNNGYAKISGTDTIAATPSTITGSVGLESTLVDNSTLYTFSITLPDGLSSAGWLEIVFPGSVKLPTTLTSVMISSGKMLNLNPVGTVNTLMNKVIITSLNSSASLIPPQTFTLTLGYIKNPSSTRPTQPFTISSYYQATSDYLVSTGSIPGITPSISSININKISITKSSQIVLDSPISYFIQFQTSNIIPINGRIKLQIPTDIKMDITNFKTNCFINKNNTGQILCDGTAILNSITNKYQLTINNIALSSNIPIQTTIKVTLDSICTNPDSTRNIIGFGITTYDGIYPIQTASTGISVQAATPATCRDVAISRLSQKNSQKTNYTIVFRQKSTFLGSSLVQITIPLQLTISSSTQCISSLTTLACQIFPSSNKILIPLPSSVIASLTYLTITLTNIINHNSFQPISNTLSILTKTPDNINKYCQYSSIVSFTNTQPSMFITLTGVYSPRIYGELTSLVIDIKPSDRLIPSYFIVSLQAQLIIQSLTCSYSNIVSGSCNVISTTSNTIKITGILSSNLMKFTIAGIRAPKYPPLIPKYTSISSFTNNNYKIDQSSSLLNKIQFIVKCTLPCKTCSDTNLSQCLSCYHDIDISTQTYYNQNDKMCYSVCPDEYYEDENTLECEPCSSNCYTCEVTMNNCTSCNSNSTYPYLNKTASVCMNACPTFYYPNLAISPIECIRCQSPCNNCINKIKCLSCVSPYFFHNQICKSACPSGITVPNIITRQCDNCSSICGTCSIKIDNCTACSQSAAFLQQKNTCVAACPPPLVINSGKCASCNSICKTCSLSALNCTSCQSTSLYPYLYDYMCYSSCPDFYYKSLLEGLCKQCILLNIGCKNCSSVSTCYICDKDYVFLNNKCYTNAPYGYYNDNGYAKTCQGQCATCDNSATNCTSCKTLNLFNNKCQSTCPSTFIGQNKICIKCQSPCNTCSNIKTNCTSCVPDLIPEVYLNNYYCTQICPQYTYGNNSNNLCIPCKSPCVQCTGQITCTTCILGKYLSATSCVDICPQGYIGEKKVCVKCTQPCQTCISTKTHCVTCIDTYYLYNSSSPSCITNCSTVGLYPDLQTQVCTGCRSPCNTCTSNSTTCTSCISTYVLQQSSCIKQCSIGYYKSALNVCQKCVQQCRSCTSLSYCLTCKLNYYLHLNFCVQSCPLTYPVITINGGCSKCTDKACGDCYENDYCKMCLEPYYLYLGKCVEKCPQNYTGIINNDKNKQCVYSPSESSLNSALSNGGNLFPVPFTITALFIGIATIMSKFQNSNTHVYGALFSLWSMLEWGSVCLSGYFFYEKYGYQKIEFYLIGGAVAFWYLLNIIAIIVQNLYLMNDTAFQKWSKSQSNKCFYYIISIISLITTHKLKQLLFTKMFNFTLLKAHLDSIHKFRIFNIFHFISFLSSTSILFSLGLIFGTYTLPIDQKLMGYIDATILTTLMIFVSIFNSKKQNGFFQEINDDGYVFNKRISQSQSILHEVIMPEKNSQDQYEEYYNQNTKTALNLLSKRNNIEQTNYKKYNKINNSSFIQNSVRDISIQAQNILGDNSRISHLDSQNISNLDFFQKKQISIQFNGPNIQYKDQSINFSRQNHEVSIQMDNFIQNNQRSIQVTHSHRDLSIQYSPNQIDMLIGMSRQQRNMSIQANPNQQQISIQYSAKPQFIQIDQEYFSHDSINQQQNSMHKSKIDNNNNSRLNQQHIKKQDQGIKQQLDLDVQQKIRKRQQQLLRQQQQLKRQQMIEQMKKNNLKMDNIKLQDKNNIFMNNKKINDIFNNDQQSNNTIMSSRDQIFIQKNNNNNNNNYPQSLLPSNQSHVYETPRQSQQLNENNRQQNTEIQIIQILSGNNNNNQQNQYKLNKQSKGFKKDNKYYVVQNNHNNNQMGQNQISLNWSEDGEENYQNNNNNKGNKISINNKNKRHRFENKDKQIQDNQSEQQQQQQSKIYNINNPHLNQPSNQFTKSISTKFISTQKYKPPLPHKNNKNEQYFDSSQDINNSQFQLQNSLQQNSDNLDNLIQNGPIRPVYHKNEINQIRQQYHHNNNNNKNKINNNNKNTFSRLHYNHPLRNNQLEKKQQQNVKKVNLTQFLQKKHRSGKSATLIRNNNNDENINSIKDKQEKESQLFDQDQDDDEEIMYDQKIQRQDPLPLPQLQLNTQNKQTNNNNNLQFRQNQILFIQPNNTLQQNNTFTQHPIPKGLNFTRLKQRTPSKPKNLSTHSHTNLPSHSHKKSLSKQKQKPLYNQLLNPSSSNKKIFKNNHNSLKQLQKQQKKADLRKKNLELMEGMLERPGNMMGNKKKEQILEDDAGNKRSSVEKIYLNKLEKKYN